MKATNAGDAFGKVLVDELVRHGVRFVCISPGSRSTPIALAFAGHPDVEVVVAHDERSSAFIALGIARATGTPTPVVSTSGTAAANYLPAVVEADLGRVPLLVVTADRPGELRATGANQAIDQVKIFGGAVRWFCEVGVPEPLETSNAYWRSLTSRAVNVATAGPAGPVHLNCALREPLVPTDEVFPFPLEGRDAARPWTEATRGARTLDPRDASLLAERLSGTERGIVVAGPGVEGTRALPRLAEALGWPLLADPLSNARFGANAISTYDALLRDRDFLGRHRPDVVLRSGQLGISRSLMRLVADSPTQILMDPDGKPLDPDRSTHTVVAADVEPTIAALLETIEDTGGSGEWLGAWRTADEGARDAIDRVLAAIEEPNEPRSARDLVAALPDGSSLFVGASMPLRDVEWFTRPRTGVSFYGNRGANGIDGSVSTPVGIAAGTGAPAYALIGDVSLLHDQNGLLSSLTGAVDLTIVCLNNDGGGIFSFLPQSENAQHFERLFGTPHGRDLSLVAGLHGCTYRKVTRAGDVADAVTAGGSGTRIVEVRTDRSRNVEIHEELVRAVKDSLQVR